MGAERNQRTDHMLATVLTVGGLTAFVLISAGTLLLFFHNQHADAVLRIGIVALLSTPVLRVALAVVAFWRERDYKYTLIAAVVLAIVILGAVLRVAI